MGETVWGTSAADVFVCGRYGLALHYNGIIWSPMASMTTYDLNGVWGAAGTILRYNGYGWKAMTSGTINTLGKIWGTGANVYVAALAGYVYRHTPSAGAPVTGLRMGEYAKPAGTTTLPEPMAATGSTLPASAKATAASTSVQVTTSSSSSSTTSVRPTTTTSKKTTTTSIQPTTSSSATPTKAESTTSAVAEPTTEIPTVAPKPPKSAGKPGGKLSTAFPVLVFPEPDKIESSFILRNTGEGALNWLVDFITCSTPGHNWLKITPADGAIAAGARQRLVFTVSRQGLAPGIHRAVVTIIDGNGLQKRMLVYLQVGKGKKGK